MLKVTKLVSGHGLLHIDLKKSSSADSQPHTLVELLEIHSQIRSVKPIIEAKIQMAEKELENMPRPERLNTVDVRSELGETISALEEKLRDGSSEHDIERVKRELLYQLKSLGKEIRVDYYYIPSVHDSESFINYAVQSAIYILKKEKYSELKYILNKLEELELLLVNSHHETNEHLGWAHFTVIDSHRGTRSSGFLATDEWSLWRRNLLFRYKFRRTYLRCRIRCISFRG
jgi:hypothetical protein